jgi:hypothetical protein
VRAEAKIAIELAYSPAAGAVEVQRLWLPAASTVLQAVQASGVLQRHPQLGLAPLELGIWGRACDGATPLCDGDRVELYRALRVDPKEARRQRYRGQMTPAGGRRGQR